MLERERLLGEVAVRLPDWRARGVRLAVAESLTGGLVSASLVSVPGISAVLHGGIVAYNTALKQRLLGVDAKLLAQVGAVHPDVAEAMAAGVRRSAAVNGVDATIGLATTGVAGPDPQDGQGVGTVFVAVASEDGVRHRALHLDGDRAAIREQATDAALALLLEFVDAWE